MTEPATNGTAGTSGLVPLDSFTVDDALMRTVRPGGVDEDHAKALASLLVRKDGEEGLPEEQLRQLRPISLVDLIDPETGEAAAARQVAHGFHRRRAYELAGRTLIPATVTAGDGEHLLTVALKGNGDLIKAWTLAERRLACHNLMAMERYHRKPWAWYAEMTGLSEPTIKNEWLGQYGEGEREVEGADGKVYVYTVTAPKKAKAGPAPIQADEVAGLYGGDEPIALPPQAITAPSSAPVAQTMRVGAAAPQAYANGNGNGHAPVAIGGGYSVTVAPKAAGSFDSAYVQIRRPTVVNPTQAIEEFQVTAKTADGTWYEWDGQGDPPTVPGSVRSLLIAWLEAQG